MSTLGSRVALAVAAACLMPQLAFGQGAIGGVVRDASGSVLPGVTVEAASPALIERVRTVVTDERGQYLVVDLRPGTYAVTFTLSGFSSLKREGLEVSSGVTLPISIELTVGGVEETLIVTGATPVVDVHNTRQETVLNRDVLDIVPRTRNQQLTGSLLPGVNVVGQADVGGSSGEPVTNLFIHGGDPNDQILAIDGMKVTEGGAGARRTFIVADNTVQEYTYETSAISAEIPSGGIRQNAIPKEGGNRFRGTIYGDFTTKSMTSDNLNAELISRGLTSSNRVGKIYDFSPAFGGPILHDRLWFFGSYRYWGEDNLPAGAYYLYDPTRAAVQQGRFWAASARLTWQATPKNKFNLYHEHQNRRLPYLGVSNLNPPETATSETSPQLHLSQVKWTSSLTNKLLVQFSGYHYYQVQAENMSADSRLRSWVPFPGEPDAWPTFEVSTGKWVGGSVVNGTFFPGTSHASWWGESASLSYITGSHAVKIGVADVQGTYFAYYPTVPPDPAAVERRSVPGAARRETGEREESAQSRFWCLRTGSVDCSALDVEPRPAFRLFQRSGRRGIGARQPVVPARAQLPAYSGRSGVEGFQPSDRGCLRHVRKRQDSDQDQHQPLCRLRSDQLSEQREPDGRRVCLGRERHANLDRCEPQSNTGVRRNRTVDQPSFGTGAISVTPADSLRAGWNARGHNWEYSASVQHELFPRVSLLVGYYRRWFENLTWTHNQAIQPSDFTPFTIVSPLNGEIITLYNLAPAKRGLSNNVLTHATDDSNVFNGVDILVNGRVGRGGTIGGGISMGRSVTSLCSVATVDPNTRRFCTVTPPLTAANQYKALAAYLLPYGVQASGTFVSTAGPVIAANYTVNSAIAGVPLTNGSLNVNLVQPATMYGDRVYRVDLRFGKSFRARATRALPYIDLLNLFNASPVLTQNNTYGPTWQRPITILPGRVIKLGVQVDF